MVHFGYSREYSPPLHRRCKRKINWL